MEIKSETISSQTVTKKEQAKIFNILLDSQGKGNHQILTNKTNFIPTNSISKSSFIGERNDIAFDHEGKN